MKENIGYLLLNLRQQASLTQEQVAEDTGIYVNNYESNRSIPSVDKFISLCRYYRAEPRDIIRLLLLEENEE